MGPGPLLSCAHPSTRDHEHLKAIGLTFSGSAKRLSGNAGGSAEEGGKERAAGPVADAVGWGVHLSGGLLLCPSISPRAQGGPCFILCHPLNDQSTLGRTQQGDGSIRHTRRGFR